MCEEFRLNSLKLIHQKMREYPETPDARILMGDLNALPDSPPILFIASQLKDAYMQADSTAAGPVGTFHGFDPAHPLDGRIDYLFSSGLHTLFYQNLHLQQGKRFPSDHTAVIARFEYLGAEN
jgi:endonuclease/exonuclease/phosphatase family metal-dependent hydrolase